MKRVVLHESQTARLFPKESDAVIYIGDFVPTTAEAEVCRVVKHGHGSAYGILMKRNVNDTEKSLFGLGPA